MSEDLSNYGKPLNKERIEKIKASAKKLKESEECQITYKGIIPWMEDNFEEDCCADTKDPEIEKFLNEISTNKNQQFYCMRCGRKVENCKYIQEKLKRSRWGGDNKE